jgi:hypothetical protein
VQRQLDGLFQHFLIQDTSNPDSSLPISSNKGLDQQHTLDAFVRFAITELKESTESSELQWDWKKLLMVWLLLLKDKYSKAPREFNRRRVYSVGTMQSIAQAISSDETRAEDPNMSPPPDTPNNTSKGRLHPEGAGGSNVPGTSHEEDHDPLSDPRIGPESEVAVGQAATEQELVSPTSAGDDSQRDRASATQPEAADLDEEAEGSHPNKKLGWIPRAFTRPRNSSPTSRV